MKPAIELIRGELAALIHRREANAEALTNATGRVAELQAEGAAIELKISGLHDALRVLDGSGGVPATQQAAKPAAQPQRKK